MTEWFPPPPTPKLARRFTCPQCHVEMALEYEPDLGGQSVPTMFECPTCDHGMSVELPGQLRRVTLVET